MKRLTGIIVWGALLASSANATVVAVPTMEEMTLSADVIARVQVRSQRVVRERERVVTLTRVAVLDAVAGSARGQELTIEQRGGVLDGESWWITGAHRFVVGEELFFFGVRPNSDDVDRVIPYGIGFGLFAVVDEGSGARVVELVGDVLALDDERGAGAPVARRFDSVAAFRESLVRMRAGEQLPRPRRAVKQPLVQPARTAREGT